MSQNTDKMYEQLFHGTPQYTFPALTSRIDSMMSETGYVILRGPAGCGKSVLARQYWSQIRSDCLPVRYDLDSIQASGLDEIQVADGEDSTCFWFDHYRSSDDLTNLISRIVDAGGICLLETRCSQMQLVNSGFSEEAIFEMAVNGKPYEDILPYSVGNYWYPMIQADLPKHYSIDSQPVNEMYLKDQSAFTEINFYARNHALLLNMIGSCAANSDSGFFARFSESLTDCGLYETLYRFLPDRFLNLLELLFKKPLEALSPSAHKIEIQILKLLSMPEVDGTRTIMSELCTIIGDSDSLHFAEDAVRHLCDLGILELSHGESLTFILMQPLFCMYVKPLFGTISSDYARHINQNILADDTLLVNLTERKLSRGLCAIHYGKGDKFDHGKTIGARVDQLWDKGCRAYDRFVPYHNCFLYVDTMHFYYLVRLSGPDGAEVGVASIDGKRYMTLIPPRPILDPLDRYFPGVKARPIQYTGCEIISVQGWVKEPESFLEYFSNAILPRSITVPEEINHTPVTVIRFASFISSNMECLEKLILPKTVVEVQKNLFMAKSPLKEVEIPATCTRIHPSAFPAGTILKTY